MRSSLFWLLVLLAVPVQAKHHRRTPVLAAPVRHMPGLPVSWDLIAKEAARAGISPITLWTIEVHETGHYRSDLWREAHNPGGIKYRHFDNLQCTRYGEYACFASPEDGIRAHAEILRQPLYDEARRATTPEEQLERIGRAGYCEPGYGWSRQTKALARRLIVLAQAD